MSEHGRAAEHTHVDVHLHFHVDATILGFFLKLDRLNERMDRFMTTNAEFAAQLGDLTTQVAKIATESAATVQRVADLEAAIGNADNVPQPILDAFAALKAQVQTVDDLVPDAPAPTP